MIPKQKKKLLFCSRFMMMIHNDHLQMDKKLQFGPFLFVCRFSPEGIFIIAVTQTQGSW